MSRWVAGPSEAALRGAFGRPLARWHKTLATDPANAKMVLLGDSTSVLTTVQELYDKLREYHTQPGQGLAGMASANIVAGGNNGSSLSAWLSDAAGDNTATYSLADLVADAPDLVVASWGLNDVRQGAVTREEMTDLLVQFIGLIRDELPGADILLRMPNSLTTTVVGTDYVNGITHQEATDLLRAAYLEIAATRRDAAVADTQAAVFGTTALAASPLMGDELHPNAAGARLLADFLVRDFIGRPQSRDSILAPNAYRFQAVGFVYNAGSGFIDIDVPEGAVGTPALEWPLSTSDSLLIDGYGVFSLSGVSFGATGTRRRILKTGDWSALSRKALVAYGSHPAEGVRGGVTEVVLDPASLAASASTTLTFTVTGATSQTGVAAVQPPSNFSTSGLLWGPAWVSATDTVSVRVTNPTGSAIDAGAGTWRFWLAR